MKVLDIIKQACAYLSLYDDYKTYFDLSVVDPAPDTLPEQISIQELEEIEDSSQMPEEKQKELELLLLSFNNIQEKLLKIMPLVTKEKITSNSNKIEYSALLHKLNKIISLKYKNKKLSFSALDNYILINNPENDKGNLEVEIEYSYFLNKVEDVQETVNLDNLVKERTLALGVASEYCFVQGLFDDADIWYKKFMQELEQDREHLRSFVMPKRSWR